MARRRRDTYGICVNCRQPLRPSRLDMPGTSAVHTETASARCGDGKKWAKVASSRVI